MLILASFAAGYSDCGFSCLENIQWDTAMKQCSATAYTSPSVLSFQFPTIFKMLLVPRTWNIRNRNSNRNKKKTESGISISFGLLKEILLFFL